MNPVSGIRNKVYGPFQCIGNLTGDGPVILSLPFTQVAGCRVMVSVTDNFGSQVGSTVPQIYDRRYPGLEVSIWGAVQSLESCVKRQHVHMLSGPMGHVFDFEEGWDTINFRALNPQGGGYDPLHTIGAADVTQQGGYSLLANIFVMPRSGFVSPGGQ